MTQRQPFKKGRNQANRSGIRPLEEKRNFNVLSVLSSRPHLIGDRSLPPPIKTELVCGDGFELGSHRGKTFCGIDVGHICTAINHRFDILLRESEEDVDLLISDGDHRAAQARIVRPCLKC